MQPFGTGPAGVNGAVPHAALPERFSTAKKDNDEIDITS